MSQRQDNIVNETCGSITLDCHGITHKLNALERYLDAVVTELGKSRNQLEEILHSGVVPEGMANQLWSRLGKFDNRVQQAYARQQTAMEKVIELQAHINVLLGAHDEARAEEAAFEAACVQYANRVLEEAQKHVE